MATTTATVPPLQRPQVKPKRSMTHPLHAPISKPGRHGPKKEKAFDPEELSRLLLAHLAAQKAKDHQRQELRAARAVQKGDGVYHHVPTVAAAAFERTTTPDTRQKAHRFAEPSVRAHLNLLSLEDTVYGHPNQKHPRHLNALQQNQALDQALLDKEILRNRNQFQWDRFMEEAAEVDRERDVYKIPQRTFNSEFAQQFSVGRRTRAARPMSMGDFWEQEIPEVHGVSHNHPGERPTKNKAKLAHDIRDHRNDWAQRDDEEEIKKSHKLGLGLGHAMKKKESTWVLLRGKDKTPKDEPAVPGPVESRSPPEGNRGRKMSFLARFKRNTS